MSLTLDIDSTDRTDVLLSDTVTIDQDAASFISTCDFALQDTGANISISEGDEVHFYDGATDYFKGEVINIIYTTLTTQERVIKIECQDLNAQLSYTTVDTKTSYDAQSDADIIDDLFDDYLATVDSETHVDIVQNPLTITIERGTLREALSQICSRTGAYFYIDFDNELHYFETESNDVGWDLSDEPDQSTSFSYFDDPVRREEGLTRLDGVYVIGANVSGWVGTHAAGDKTTVVKDNRITTSTGVTQRGQAILDACGNTKVIYEVGTYKAGLRAGMDVGFKCDLYDVDDTLTVRKLRLTFEEDESPRYELELGDPVNPSLVGQRVTIDNIGQGLGPVPAIRQPISSRGWSHDIEFSADTYNMVTWYPGTITLADGTQYGIGPFPDNTGSMGSGETHYVYLDTDASTSSLQSVADSPSTAVGENKILIAVCKPQEDTNKDAIFQVFGGHGQQVFITADNIAGGTITADEIASNTIEAGNISSNTITADEIAASAITATELAAGAVTATKLAVANADQFFTQSDGLLLLGPHCPISNDKWESLRGQEAEISGPDAPHLVGGPWAGTKALVVEPATTNYIGDSLFKDNVTDWSGDTVTRETSFGWRGGSCMKIVYDSGSETTAFFDEVMSWGDGQKLVFQARLRGGAGTVGESAVLRLYTWNSSTSSWDSTQSAAITLTNDWQYLDVAHTTASAETGQTCRVRVSALNGSSGDTIYADGVQLEKDFSSSLCYGDFAHCSWDGTQYGSHSSRSVTTVDADEIASILDGRDAFSIGIWVQMGDDYNGNWPELGNNRILDCSGADRFNFRFDASNQNLEMWDSGFGELTHPANFNRGEWKFLVGTFDYASGSYKFYVDGVLVDSATNAGSGAQAFNQAAIGSKYDTSSDQGNFRFAEVAVFDTILTAEEVAALYQRNAPLVDVGAFDTPGLYILDGRFRVMSSVTGSRIEMAPDEIAGYDDSNTKQFYLRSSDGKALAGGGDVWLDEDGVTITQGSGDVNSIKWETSGGDKLCTLNTFWNGGASDDIIAELRVTQDNVTAGKSMIRLRAYDGSTNVDFLVTDNGTVNATEVTDFILNDGSGNWLDFGNNQDCTIMLCDNIGNYEFQIQDSDGMDMFLVDSNGNGYFDGDIEGDGVISTNSGEPWDLGGTASGTVTPDTKIHVKIDGSWYTLQAESGLQ
jgi:hypothetical protein